MSADLARIVAFFAYPYFRRVVLVASAEVRSERLLLSNFLAIKDNKSLPPVSQSPSLPVSPTPKPSPV